MNNLFEIFYSSWCDIECKTVLIEFPQKGRNVCFKFSAKVLNNLDLWMYFYSLSTKAKRKSKNKFRNIVNTFVSFGMTIKKGKNYNPNALLFSSDNSLKTFGSFCVCGLSLLETKQTHAVCLFVLCVWFPPTSLFIPSLKRAFLLNVVILSIVIK